MSPRLSQKMAGPVGKTAERARYIELTRQGLTNSEICRMLGIDRKTGSKWRNGRRERDPRTEVVRQYAPIVEVRAEPVISPRFLSEEERVQLADLRKAGHTIRAIAAVLGRAPSTISRELRRNSGRTGVYRPFHAQKLARVRRSRVRPGKIAANPVLRQRIEELICASGGAPRKSAGIFVQRSRVTGPCGLHRRRSTGICMTTAAALSNGTTAACCA